MSDERRDFIISYNNADRAWAEWIAWQLEAYGYTVFVQAWDFGAGSNFVREMQRAASKAERTIAVLSPDYLTSKFTQPEWYAAFAQDPTGEKRLLLPVRVRECALEGLLPQIVYVDLVGLEPAAATAALLAAAKGSRGKPSTPPAFPGSPARTGDHEPRFPGTPQPAWTAPNPRNPGSAKVTIDVLCDNALQFEADVLALKFAQHPYGVDAAVSQELLKAGRKLTFPEPWEARLEQGVSGVAATRILFVGVPPLVEFGYRDVRTFGRMVLSSLAVDAPETRHVAVTIHGPGCGLDESEAFAAEIAGLVDALRSGDAPKGLTKITVVERNRGRAQRLQALLKELVPSGWVEADSGTAPSDEKSPRLSTAGVGSEAKEHVFVAMPFREEMDDVYHYGIQSAVHSAGYLCERADLSTFTGDVLQWVRDRIKKASLVVADLTGANANVYLEVGFAWGCGRPTVLLVRDVKDLTFDVRGQRCLVYKKIRDLEDSLTKELAALRANGI